MKEFKKLGNSARGSSTVPVAAPPPPNRMRSVWVFWDLGEPPTTTRTFGCVAAATTSRRVCTTRHPGGVAAKIRATYASEKAARHRI